MRRPIITVAVAALILAAATVAGFGIAACGGSSGSAETAQGAGSGQPPDMSALFTEALDPLVQDGAITSDQQAAVVEALAASMPSGRSGAGGQAPSPGATPPAGEASGSEGAPPGGAPQQGSMPDPSAMIMAALDVLVDDGAITSAQQTTIAEALTAAMQQGGPGQQSGQST